MRIQIDNVGKDENNHRKIDKWEGVRGQVWFHLSIVSILPCLDVFHPLKQHRANANTPWAIYSEPNFIVVDSSLLRVLEWFPNSTPAPTLRVVTRGTFETFSRRNWCAHREAPGTPGKVPSILGNAQGCIINLPTFATRVRVCWPPRRCLVSLYSS
jgi:hypothetical protein